MRRPLWLWLLLLAQVAMWGSGFLLIKVAVAEIEPAVVAAVRLVIAAAVLGAIVLATGRRVPLGRRHLGYFAALAVTGNCLPFWLIAWAEQHVGAGLAGILMAVMPLATLALAHVFVGGERASAPRVAGFVLGFGGIVVLVGPDALAEISGTGMAFRAELALLAAAICYASSAILARNRPPTEPLVGAAGVMVAAAVIMTPVAMATGGGLAFDPVGAPGLAVLALGLVSTALAGVTFLRIIDAAGPTFLSLINYLIPIWAFAGSVLLLGERAEWRAVLALALILAGIALAETLGRRSLR